MLANTELKQNLLSKIFEILNQEIKSTQGKVEDALGYADNYHTVANGDNFDQDRNLTQQEVINKRRSLFNLINNRDALQSVFNSASNVNEEIEMLSLITVKVDNSEVNNTYFISPIMPGKTIEIDGQKITLITDKSPVAQNLKGKVVGSIVYINDIHNNTHTYDVLAIC